MKRKLIVIILSIILIISVILNIIQFKKTDDNKEKNLNMYECSKDNINTEATNLTINETISIYYDNTGTVTNINLKNDFIFNTEDDYEKTKKYYIENNYNSDYNYDDKKNTMSDTTLKDVSNDNLWIKELIFNYEETGYLCKLNGIIVK